MPIFAADQHSDLSMWVSLLFFVIFSTGLIFLSLPSFRRANSHGVFRFVGWEALLALLILNIPYWRDDPILPRQIVSWLFLAFSIYLAVESFYLLITRGKPGRERKDNTLLGLEKTTRMVTSRIYRFIRHPMYSSLIFLAWGAFLKQINWLTFSLTIVATVFLVIGAMQEERENIEYFGEQYKLYMVRTKRFIPFLV